LTDHNRLYGAIEVYSECRDAWLNPIFGYEVFVAPSRRTEREARQGAGCHLTLLAENRIGCRNLVKMASAAFLEGYHYVLRIGKELLMALS
jgi:DNA polymerase-3 subunit alpha